MTSSSVTSSVVPMKLVSRRSISRAVVESALPRNAPMSCCRSVLVSGRKSMMNSSLENENETYHQPDSAATIGTRAVSSIAVAGQLGQQLVDAAVDPWLVQVGRQRLAVPQQEI